MNYELWDGCDKWDEWDRWDGERIVNSELDTSCKLAPAGAYHREIHTNEYFRNIADRLEEAEADGLNDKMLSELCVRDELEAIRNDLLFNNIIW